MGMRLDEPMLTLLDLMLRVRQMKNLITIPLLLLAFLSGCQENKQTSLDPYFPTLPDPRPTGLVVPVLSIGVGIESGDYTLNWTSSPNAEWYTVESDHVEDFSAPALVYSGPEKIHYLGFASEHDFSLFYRVRAERPDSVSRWSEPLVFP